ncbi:MAG: prepilin-type N-terminal cleavage/methylation domain-containing protein [Sedimentisphaerales bacterium]|nr:prepilin-type N-terminal cleavage/methylation domain-containing protein [Sedimentisphaerales bacterium]
MKAKGFTLVEILIVVVILGILAAIVIPQFTEASTEAKESRLCTDLQTMRSQIELYKAQHNDRLPGSQTVGSTTGIGSVGTATFVQALTGYTDVDGDVAAAPGPNIYGPYMQKIPTNAFNNLSNVTFNAGTTGQAGTNLAAWNLDPDTGKFQADDNLLCSDGVTFHADL